MARHKATRGYPISWELRYLQRRWWADWKPQLIKVLTK